MSVAVRVQHHPSRAHLLDGLLASLAGFHDVAAVEDPGGETADTWRAHAAALRSTPSGASHLLALQDDAIACDRLHIHVEDLVATVPDRIVALFTPGFSHLRRRVQAARAGGERLIVFPVGAFVPLVGIVYPAAQVEGLLAFASGEAWPRARSVARADDSVVAQYVRAFRLEVLATVPSLVEHRSDLVSVVRPGHRDGSHRRAAWFAG